MDFLLVLESDTQIPTPHTKFDVSKSTKIVLSWWRSNERGWRGMGHGGLWSGSLSGPLKREGWRGETKPQPLHSSFKSPRPVEGVWIRVRSPRGRDTATTDWRDYVRLNPSTKRWVCYPLVIGWLQSHSLYFPCESVVRFVHRVDTGTRRGLYPIVEG